jgi:hypothetical protein
MNSPSSGQHSATIRLVKIALLSINSSRQRAEKIPEPGQERCTNDDSDAHTVAHVANRR